MILKTNNNEQIKVCVFCAASNECKKYFLEAAYKLGKRLAEYNIKIIYGGGKVGLMGNLADGALSAGGKIMGVIPTLFKDLQLEHPNATEMIVVADLHKRESIMINEADAIVVLPGGCGTIEELLQAITWKLLGLIIKPIIIVNLGNYFSPLLEMLNRTVEEKFLDAESLKLWTVVTNIDECVEDIRSKLINPCDDNVLNKIKDY